jgi:GntR family transcriptional regulator
MSSRPPLPRHRAIAEELRAGIRAGLYPPGSQLPSELELARSYGVARGTVRQALHTLKAQGTVASRQGARGVVLAEPRSQSFSELISFSAWARSLGEVPSGRVVSLGRHLADELDAGRLDIPHGSAIFRLVRVRLLGARPVLIERTTFPEWVGRLVAAIDLERQSIYAELAGRGVLFASARHTVSAMPAEADDAELLELPAGTPLLRQLRRTSSRAGEPLEWSDDRYRGDTVSFSIDNSAAAGRTIGPVAALPGAA